MKKIFTALSILLIASSVSWSQSGWSLLNADTLVYWYWTVFTNPNTGYIVGYKEINGRINPNIIKTTNAGSNWFKLTTPMSDSLNRFFRCVYFTDNNTGFITSASTTGYVNGKIIRTTDGGVSWSVISLPVNKNMGHVYFINSTTGFATGYQTILKTTDAGLSWVPVLLIQGPSYFFAIEFTDVNIGYAVGTYGVIIKTTDGGNNWIDLYSSTGINLFGLSFGNANTGIAVGGVDLDTNIILRTTNAGYNWYMVNYTPSIFMFHSVKFISPTIAYVTGCVSQIFKTTNGGANWFKQTLPLPDSSYSAVRCVYFTSINTGYLVTTRCVHGVMGHIFKTTTGGEPVGIKPVSNEWPAQFSLFQNYPNPFNPTTKIKFDVPLANGIGEGLGVRLVVYDLLGRELATLVNENLKPGSYEIEWDASNYPSGVYFYKLITNDFTNVKKMVLLK